MDEEVLAGGVGNAGAVVRVGDHVLRPASGYSHAIHGLLGHLHDRGFGAVPKVVGIDPDGRERLVFIPGDVPVLPFPDWSLTDGALASTASLLRRYHDAVAEFAPPVGAVWSTEMADPTPGPHPVLCHNDVCPENVVFRDGVAVALLDFEFASPGRRSWDLAALASMCIPLDTREDAARTGRAHLDPFARLGAVAEGYGLDGPGRTELITAIAERFADAGAFVRRRVEAGEPAFIAMWDAMGGQERYDRRRDWFEDQRTAFAAALGIPAQR